jgi:glycosyltransferase involved in cell wall biosynthesis
MPNAAASFAQPRSRPARVATVCPTTLLPIIHVIDSLGFGGSERSLVEMLPYFKRAGLSPSVACLRDRDSGVTAAVERLGIPVHVLNGTSRLAHVRELRRLIHNRRPALLHTCLFESDLVGRLAAVRTGVPVITSLVSTPYDPVRHLDPHVAPGRLRAVRFIDSITAQYLTTWFHAVSSAVRSHAIASLGIPHARVTVIERGRDPRRLRAPGVDSKQCLRARFGLSTEDEVLLNVGRQEFAKGQDTLLLAFDSVYRSRPHAVLIVAGREGHATRELAARRDSLPSAHRIRFLGHREDVWDLLEAADVFVFPSLYEGLPGAVIEAMASGVPIVASNIPSIAEMVDNGRNATLVVPGDADALAAAIVGLLQSCSQRRAYAEHARRAYLERFTLERSATAMVRLFRQVAHLHTGSVAPNM